MALALTRKRGEVVKLIDTETGLEIRVIYVDLAGNRIKLAFDAPPRVKIIREELEETIDDDPPKG